MPRDMTTEGCRRVFVDESIHERLVSGAAEDHEPPSGRANRLSDRIANSVSPTTVFYDWLYLSALFPHREWLRWRIDGEMTYAGFTDIEFNPSKSINCQAKTCALFVSLMRENRLETYLNSADAFIDGDDNSRSEDPNDQGSYETAPLRMIPPFRHPLPSVLATFTS